VGKPFFKRGVKIKAQSRQRYQSARVDGIITTTPIVIKFTITIGQRKGCFVKAIVKRRVLVRQKGRVVQGAIVPNAEVAVYLRDNVGQSPTFSRRKTRKKRDVDASASNGASLELTWNGHRPKVFIRYVLAAQNLT